VNQPLVSVVVPCYNEQGNVDVLYERLCAVFAKIADIRFQILFIDNASVDSTQEVLRAIAERDARVKVIFNIRILARFVALHAFFESAGDAVICMAVICRIRLN